MNAKEIPNFAVNTKNAIHSVLAFGIIAISRPPVVEMAKLRTKAFF